MKNQGYFQLPTIHAETVVFVSEDDLWIVPAGGGVARRLTTGLAAVSHPALSPDGKWLAFSGRDDGTPEVYVMPAGGGEARRLTYLGAATLVVGWTRDGRVICSSNSRQPFNAPPMLLAVSLKGGGVEQIPVGPARSISFGPGGGMVIGRNAPDPARWKRYRGGTAGDLWIDTAGRGEFRRLISLKSDLSRPMWVGKRIYFLSDHESIGNLYSCTPAGTDLKRHTRHEGYYVRYPSTDGRRIIYQAGADLFVFDPATDKTKKIEVEYDSPRAHRQRKFVDAARYLDGFDPHPKGHLLALTTRGKCFTMGHWEGPVIQHGAADGVRYRLPRWLNDGKRVVAVSDAGGEEALEVYTVGGEAKEARLGGLDIGRVIAMQVCPVSDRVALSNHRNELIVVDLKTKKRKVLDRSEWAPIGGFDWSPDGRWVAYGFGMSQHTAGIRMCEAGTGKVEEVTRPVLQDAAPAFDPDGRFLYFLSSREFDPVYDNLHFDLGFPRGVKPYLIPLRKDIASPFVGVPKPAGEKGDAGKKKENEKGKKPAALKIDFEGIKSRVVAFPVADGRYQQIAGIRGKVLFTSVQAEGALGGDAPSGEAGGKATLESYDLEAQKSETLVSGISYFTLSADLKTLVYRTGSRLRVVKAGEKPDDSPAGKEPAARKSGWVDMSRVRVSIRPGAEWRQMFRETWRLQRDHFWTPDMSKIDWQAVYKRYLPLVDRVSTRGELSDLLWEMQGELGTSHAYEFGGDHRQGPRYSVGLLGADFTYVPGIKAWRVRHIVQGDAWDEKARSPLAAAGVNVWEGDTLLAIGSRRLDAETHPNALLVHQAGVEVLLTVGDARGKAARDVTVRTLSSETAARYREWVESNRAAVHKATKGKVGYVHIPDMGPRGYAEFHRAFLAEVDRQGLIVDVRFNGGGHVSELILEKLARRRIAYNQSRWFNVNPYPQDSVAGPIVAITNEYAGSDGDIFSHGFKMLKLGKLVGKRTWGGVIGIWPRHALVDGGLTTQPEFSFWFEDVGWGVENYGTDPDIEVEMRPQDFAAGRDPQLARALEEMGRELKARPVKRPEMGGRPDLSERGKR